MSWENFAHPFAFGFTFSLLSRQDSIVAGMVQKPSINTFAISAMFLYITRIFFSNPRLRCLSPWPPKLVAGLVALSSAILKFSQHTPQNISKIIKIINILHYCHYFPYIHIACLYSELNIIFQIFWLASDVLWCAAKHRVAREPTPVAQVGGYVYHSADGSGKIQTL